MNILLINDYWEGGGAEAVFRYQGEILKKEHEVAIFYGYATFPDRKASPADYIYSRRMKQKLACFLKSSPRFDCVIIHNYNGALSPSVLDVLKQYKKQTGCKIIHYAHDFHLVCPNRGYFYVKEGKTINFQQPPTIAGFIAKRLDYRGFIHSWLKKIQWIWAYPAGKKQAVFDLVLAPSDFLTAQIRQLYPSLNIQRMYNSCNALSAATGIKQREPGDTLRLVYFGRIAKEKGLVEFITALRAASIPYTFTMIGEGEEKERLQQLITQHNLTNQIFLKEKMNAAALFAELENYDVFVLPSLWYENAPLSIVEAASLDLGLFLARHGGVLEIGRICGAKHFFDPASPADILENLTLLYRDFRNGSLPKANIDVLQGLFSEKTYLQNLQKQL